MGKDKTGRPVDTPVGSGLDVTGQDFERRAPIIPPGTVSYIYSGEFRTTTKTATFTLSTEMVVLVDASGGGITLTLPSAVSNTHKVYVIKKVDSTGNVVTIEGDANTETIDGEVSVKMHLQYQYIWIICDGSDWYIIGGEYVKMEELLEQQLDLLEEIRDNTKDTVTHLSLGSDEELEGGD